MLGDGITIEEFEQLPSALAKNHELVDGKLVNVSERTGYHNSLRDFLLIRLAPHAEGRIICEQDFDFDGNAHGPDLSLVGPSKLHLIDPQRRVQRFVPDLAVEIVAKNDKFDGIVGKAVRYRRCGTKEAWLLSPSSRRAFVWSEDRDTILTDDQMFESKLIPGFSIRLADLFDRAR